VQRVKKADCSKWRARKGRSP